MCWTYKNCLLMISTSIQMEDIRMNKNLLMRLSRSNWTNYSTLQLHQEIIYINSHWTINLLLWQIINRLNTHRYFPLFFLPTTSNNPLQNQHHCKITNSMFLLSFNAPFWYFLWLFGLSSPCLGPFRSWISTLKFFLW